MPSGSKRRIEVTGLTKDQKPDDPEESARITRCGGYVSPASPQLGPPRVWLRKGEGPGLAMARSLGDHISSHVGVIATPVVTQFVMEVGYEYVLILASDGVWEFIENDEACEIVVEQKTAADSCAALIDESSRRWRAAEGNYRDDITSIVCHFPFFPKRNQPNEAIANGTSTPPIFFKVRPRELSEGPVAADEDAQTAAVVGGHDESQDAEGSFQKRRLTVQGEFVEGSDEAKRLEQLREQYS